MKGVLYVIAVILLFASCNNGKQIEISSQNSKRFFEGGWVKSDYVDDIIRTKSPYVSRSKLKGIVTLLIDTGKIYGDSLVVGASLNNHEGYGFTVYFKQGHDKSSFITNIIDYGDSTNYYELGYSNLPKDTLILFHFNRRHKLIDTTKFIKVKQRISDEAAEPIQFIVNKILFTAKYKLYDSTGNETPVQFYEDGNVKGFKDYNNYLIGTDFIGPDTVDYVGLRKDNEKYDCYAFEIIQDTIKLYETSEGKAGEAIPRKLKYVLKWQ